MKAGDTRQNASFALRTHLPGAEAQEDEDEGEEEDTSPSPEAEGNALPFPAEEEAGTENAEEEAAPRRLFRRRKERNP